MQARKFPKSRKFVMFLGDLALIVFSYMMITFVMMRSVRSDVSAYLCSEMFICILFGTFVFLYIGELYTIEKKRFADLLVDILLTLIGVLVVSLFFNHFVLGDIYARKFVLLYSLSSILSIGVWRYLMWRIELKLHGRSKAVLIFGNEEECTHIFNKMCNQAQLNMRLKYVCSDINSIDWKNAIDKVDVAILCESIDKKAKTLLINYCYQHNKELLLSPSYYELFCSEAKLSRLDDIPVLVPQALHPSIESRIMKRVVDIIFSTMVLIATFPIMILCWLAVFLWEGRPVFSRQIRVGKFGESFNLIKFRTKDFDGKKITDTGKLLEWLHLDELPEFWNVIKGEMSVVGPNADLPDIAKKNIETIPEYTYRVNVKPGVTGLAQVYGDNCTDKIDKLIYDLKYIQQLSIREDLVIIIQTMRTLFAPSRLYGKKKRIGRFDFDEYNVLEKAYQERDLPKTPFSVLMSVYRKENPKYFRLSVYSVMDQSYKPAEVLIVQDGELTEELYAVCKDIELKYKDVIRFVRLKKNVGLGLALQRGVKECKYDLIARMDTDDIAKKERFELQVRQFDKHPDLAICGGYIEEFNDSPDRILTLRKVPLTESDIYEYTKLRSPFNHMTVMFKRQAILEVGNYQPFLLLEDYYLWYRLVSKGYHTKNIPVVLVSARADDGMIKRRGGIHYFGREMKLYNKFYKDKYINILELLFAFSSRLLGHACPRNLRRFIYQVFLR